MTTPTTPATTPTYVQDNQQFKSVAPDGSLNLVTDNTALQGLYGGSTKYQTVDQYNASKLAGQPATQPPGANVNTKGDGTGINNNPIPTPTITNPPGANINTPDKNGYGFDAKGNPNPAPAGTTTPAGGSADISGGTGTTGTGTGNATLDNLLKQSNPDLPKYEDQNSPDIQSFKNDQTTTLNNQEDTQNKQYDTQMQAEITQAQNNNAQLSGQATNKLAALGVLGNSTYAMQYMSDLKGKLDANVSAIQSKYAVLKMNLDTKTKQAIIDSVNKEIDNRNKQITNEINQLTKSAAQANSLYKSMTSSQLAEEKLKVQQAYNQGRLDLTTAQNQTKQITAEQKAKNTIVKGAKGAMYTQNEDGSLSPVQIKGGGTGAGTGTGSGSSTTTTKQTASQIQSQATNDAETLFLNGSKDGTLPKNGNDGHANPATYNAARNAWITDKHDVSKFDSLFAKYVDPTHPQDYQGAKIKK